MRNFSKVHDLSQIGEKSLQRILSSLGLKWRTKMLLQALRVIDNDFGGDIPIDKHKLLSLPGIGDYIASAVRVFSISSDDPLIDTNTVRIISRVYGIKATDSTRKSKVIASRYSDLRNDADPKAFGFSMIDLASLICKPRMPECSHCPVNKHCITGSVKRKP